MVLICNVILNFFDEVKYDHLSSYLQVLFLQDLPHLSVIEQMLMYFLWRVLIFEYLAKDSTFLKN